ncbi:MAG: hypothetical protein RL757_547 [Bacteroidota bacterium]|jgi:CHAT domain-containing protein
MKFFQKKYYVFVLLCTAFWLLAQNGAAPKSMGVQIDELLKDCQQQNKVVAVQKIDSFLTKHTAISETPDSAMALVWHKRGVYQYLQKKFVEGIQSYEKSLAMRKVIFGAINNNVAKSYLNIGKCYHYLNRHEKANDYFTLGLDALDRRFSTESNDLEKELVYEIGDNCESSGDLERAFQYLQKGFAISEQQKDTLKTVSSLLRLGIIEKKRKNLEAAITFLKKAISIKSDNNEVKEAQRGAWLNLAQNTRVLQPNNIKQQLFYFNESEKIAQSQKDTSFIADLRHETSVSYVAARDYPKALALENNAIALRQRFDRQNLPESYTNLGNIYAALQQHNAALTSVDQAIQILAQPENQERRADQLNAFAAKANALENYFRSNPNQTEPLEAANRAFLSYDSVVAQTRNAIGEDESKYLLHENAMPVYERGIANALLLFEKTGKMQFLNHALAFMEQNKSLVLLDALRDQRAKQFGNIPEDKLQAERDLRIEIASLEKQQLEQQQNPKNSELEKVKSELFEKKQQLDNLKSYFERNFPKYFSVRYAPVQPLNVAAIQSQLDDSTALVEYFWGDSTLFNMTISKTNVRYDCIPIKGSNLIAQLQDFRQTIANPEYFDKNYRQASNQYLSGGYQLFEQLLNKNLKNLTSPKPIRRLRIVADGALGYIPFDALLTEPPRQENWSKANIPYALNRFAISYLWSNTLLATPPVSNPIPEIFGGFGIEYDDQTLNNFQKDSLLPNEIRGGSTRGGNLTRLEFADDEVKKIFELLKGKGNIWLNGMAKKSVFVKQAQDFGILHLAMHGYLDTKNPLRSALIFSHDSTQKQLSDNQLTGFDLCAMQLRAGLVVLSACNTGNGELKRGEGVMSLARAFAYAGCPSTVMSLWSISDNSTSEIMQYFYENLRDGQPKDIALQQAKRKYLMHCSPDQRLPNYWSASVLAGSNEDLKFVNPTFYWKRVGGWAAILSVFIAWIFYVKRRKNYKK